MVYASDHRLRHLDGYEEVSPDLDQNADDLGLGLGAADAGAVVAAEDAVYANGGAGCMGTVGSTGAVRRIPEREQ